MAALVALAGSYAVSADNDHQSKTKNHFRPGNLVLSRTTYHNDPDNVIVGQSLPPNCVSPNCLVAAYDGTFPTVFNNAPIDGSFGITSKIYLDQLTPDGNVVNTLEVPNSSNGHGATDQMVTSFSSKSELALNLSANGQILTFMGYLSPIDVLDVSNSNTLAAIDPTNPVPESVYRVIADVDAAGHFQFTLSNAYSGNNGRAAILNNGFNSKGVYYLSGNAGNGSGTQPSSILLAAGAQIATPSDLPEVLQSPPPPTPVGSFNITQLGDLTATPPGSTFNKADKIGKDDNFRGLTVFNNVIYLTKGSGGNGVNTVYFVDATGNACPAPKTASVTAGTGLPVTGAPLPLAPLVYATPLTSPPGLPSNMCVLAGFPTLLASATTGVAFPFGLFFADDHTLYVADEGDGFNSDTTLYTHAATQTTAGLQKWVLDSAAGQWKLAYVLQAGLNLGTAYTVDGYPTGPNPGSGKIAGLPWSPATDGLRNLTGRVDGDTVTIWAVTSTVSGSGDQGADPNKLVMIKDQVSATTTAEVAKESFVTLKTAAFGETLRGISFTPIPGE
jgi:hypothetical protein